MWRVSSGRGKGIEGGIQALHKVRGVFAFEQERVLSQRFEVGG